MSALETIDEAIEALEAYEDVINALKIAGNIKGLNNDHAINARRNLKAEHERLVGDKLVEGVAIDLWACETKTKGNEAVICDLWVNDTSEYVRDEFRELAKAAIKTIIGEE